MQLFYYGGSANELVACSAHSPGVDVTSLLPLCGSLSTLHVMCLLPCLVRCPCMPFYVHIVVAAALAAARPVAGHLGFLQVHLCYHSWWWLCPFSDAAAHKALVFRQHRTPSSLSHVALALCTVSVLCCSCVPGFFQLVYMV
jgi:hypothetical protein